MKLKHHFCLFLSRALTDAEAAAPAPAKPTLHACDDYGWRRGGDAVVERIIKNVLDRLSK